MDMPNTLINDRSSSLILDGRRPTAGGMPPNEEGNDELYSKNYNTQYKYYSTWKYVWTPEQWRQKYLEMADAYWTFARHPGKMEALWDLWHEAIDRENRIVSVSIARDKLQRELGPREFTLTYSPAWYADDATAKDAMRVAIDKLTRYYKHEIIEFHAIGEYTEAGRAHVHCYYELDGGHKITDKNFKRAWPHWRPSKKLGTGHQGGHHANVRGKSDFFGYIEKDLDTAWLNVHITRNANDDQTTQREGNPQELSQSRRDDDSDSSDSDC